MVSFKLAAVKILRKANKELHYEDITKRALKEGLIETSGSTPEATMNAQISVDIKHKKDDSPFIRIKPGYYSLNPNYSPEEQKKEEKEEQQKEKEETAELISTQYTGKGGEHRVVSELMFLGYNASIMGVDEGIDIVATKNDRLYNIQVKTSNENKFKYYVFDIRISSFEKYNNNNTYYIFVLKSVTDINFLIIPYNELQKNIDLGIVKTVNKETRYRVNIRIRDGVLYLGNKDNDLSYYMNNWGLIK